MTTLLPPRPSISLVDARGNMTRPWTIYFEAVFARLGGSSAPSVDDLAQQVSQLPDTSSSIEHTIAIAASYASQLPMSHPALTPEDAQDPRVPALEAEVARLRVLIEGLLQGYQA